MLEDLYQKESGTVSRTLEIKLKNSLGPYKNEVKRIRDFSEKEIMLCGKVYDLQVILLEKESESEYTASLRISIG